MLFDFMIKFMALKNIYTAHASYRAMKFKFQ
jgi:hypothetical protein